MKLCGKEINKSIEKKFRRAVKIAEEIDNENLDNFDEYCSIVDYLEENGFDDPIQIIERWDSHLEWDC